MFVSRRMQLILAALSAIGIAALSGAGPWGP